MGHCTALYPAEDTLARRILKVQGLRIAVGGRREADEALYDRHVQALLPGRRGLDNGLGFGVGLATGLATVGRIDSEWRLDDTAVGNGVNLASRPCSSAGNSEILVDRVAAQAVGSRAHLVELEARASKGFDGRWLCSLRSSARQIAARRSDGQADAHPA